MMDANDFSAWLERRGLNAVTAAPLLKADPTEVRRWRNGVRPVPRRVVGIVELLDEVAELKSRVCAHCGSAPLQTPE